MVLTLCTMETYGRRLAYFIYKYIIWAYSFLFINAIYTNWSLILCLISNTLTSLKFSIAFFMIFFFKAIPLSLKLTDRCFVAVKGNALKVKYLVLFLIQNKLFSFYMLADRQR